MISNKIKDYTPIFDNIHKKQKNPVLKILYELQDKYENNDFMFDLCWNVERIILLPRRIKTYIKYTYQFWIRGFSNRQLWSLEHTISKFVLPRLKAFKTMTHSFPSSLATFEEWEKILDDMIFFHQTVADFEHDFFDQSRKDDYNRYRRGKYYFFKYYEHLWD